MLRPEVPGAGNGKRLRFEILVSANPHGGGTAYPMRQEPPNEEELRVPTVWSGGHAILLTEGLTIPKESWSKINGNFEARPDRVNKWTITLPEELIKAVRGSQNGSIPKAK